MTELETIQHAKNYIDDLANGINPLTKESANENDIINNVRISRCLFYVSGILQKVIENDGVVGKKENTTKRSFALSDEQIKQFIPSKTPVTITELTKAINDLNNLNNSQKLHYNSISNWLVENGALESTENANGGKHRRPTQLGMNMGISVETRNGVQGEYQMVVYNQNAQRFIVDNLRNMIPVAIPKEPKPVKPGLENQGKPWTESDIEKLCKMFNDNVSIKEIASYFKRTDGGIRSRLIKLGLIEK